MLCANRTTRRRRARLRASAAPVVGLVLALGVAGCGGSSHAGTSTAHLTTAASGSSTRAGTGTVRLGNGGATGTGTGAAATSPTVGLTNPVALGFPLIATKNTTRVAGSDPVDDAAAVALATFPSTAPGTHPKAVTIAPTDDWQAAIAASSLIASPFDTALLLSTPGSLPPATRDALGDLAPTGDSTIGGASIVRVGDVPAPAGHGAAVTIGGGDPYAIAAAIDAYEARVRGKESVNVVIASAQDPAYAMPAAGWAAESGEPILFVNDRDVPGATQEALLAHRHPRIFVLGPASVIPDSVLAELARYGPVRRIAGSSPAATSVAFAGYRYPACPTGGQQCAHIPGSFGWAVRSPGHGYVLLSQSRPLDAAASAALSASGSFGPQLLVAQPNTLPQSVLNYFVAYEPGYSSEGPTTAVYDHAWLIGPANVISAQVQAQVDSLLEVAPVATK